MSSLPTSKHTHVRATCRRFCFMIMDIRTSMKGFGLYIIISYTTTGIVWKIQLCMLPSLGFAKKKRYSMSSMVLQLF